MSLGLFSKPSKTKILFRTAGRSIAITNKPPSPPMATAIELRTFWRDLRTFWILVRKYGSVSVTMAPRCNPETHDKVKTYCRKKRTKKARVRRKARTVPKKRKPVTAVYRKKAKPPPPSPAPLSPEVVVRRKKRSSPAVAGREPQDFPDFQPPARHRPSIRKRRDPRMQISDPRSKKRRKGLFF